jgi:hypothetical protein
VGQKPLGTLKGRQIDVFLLNALKLGDHLVKPLLINHKNFNKIEQQGCSLQYPLKDQYGPRVFFLEFPFFAENMIIRSILNLWWHFEILKLILGVVRGMFTKRLKGTRRLLYTVKSDFFEMTALHSKC